MYCKSLEIFFSKTAQQNSWILHTNSLWICVIEICSNSGPIYIIGVVIANDILNRVNMMQTFENLLLQNYSTVFLNIAHKYSLGMCNKSLFKRWRHLHYLQNNSKRQFELAANLMQTFENLLLQNYSTEF